jgi:DNA-binding beta-propeller fold protein YncE
MLSRILTLTVLLAASALSFGQLKQIAIIDLPGRPGFDSVAFANGHLVIAHAAAGTVDIFNPVRRRLVAQVTGLARPTGIAVDEAAGKVYIANSDAKNIVIINVKDWQVQGTIPLQAQPVSLLIAGKTLYATQPRASSIATVSLPQGTPGPVIAAGGSPQAMTFDPQQNLLLATVQETSEVIAIDPSGQIVKRVHLAASQPTGLALDAAQHRLFVAVRSAVLVLDPQSGNELARIASPQGTDNLWFDAAARTLYASASDGSLSIIQGNNNQFTQVEQPTQVRGNTFAVDSEKNYVYVAGGREGRSKLVILRRGASPANDSQNAQKPQQQPVQQEAKQPVPTKPVLQNSVQPPIPGQQLVKVQ